MIIFYLQVHIHLDNKFNDWKLGPDMTLIPTDSDIILALPHTQLTPALEYSIL